VYGQEKRRDVIGIGEVRWFIVSVVRLGYWETWLCRKLGIFTFKRVAFIAS